MNPHLRAAQKQFDVDAKAILREARAQSVNVPCASGCSACCYDVATVIGPEADELAERVQSWPTSKREGVKQRIADWYERAKAAGIDTETHLQDLRTYHHARLRCPLLGEDGRCMVYDIRPFGCRAHYVIAPDASPCALRAEEPEVKVLLFEDPLLRAFVGLTMAEPHRWTRDLTEELLTPALAERLG